MGPEIAATAVSAASIGSLALDAGSSIIKGHGEAAGQEYMAARDRRSAEIGRIRADQTDVQLREELQTTLGMIDVTRSAANTDPLSPTGLAIKANKARISDRARLTKVGSIRAQAAEDEASARYRTTAAKYALLGGYTSGGAKLFRGFSSLSRGVGASGAKYGASGGTM